MAENEGLRTTGEAIVKSILPDVCLTPPAMLPVPYQIIGRFSDGVRFSSSVRMTCLNTINTDSRLPTVYGDEAGEGGGIFSGVNKGWCRSISFSPTVRAQKHNITHHTSFYWMNCAGPDGTPNTIGMVTYVENVSAVYIGPLGAIEGNTNPPPESESPWEDLWQDIMESSRKIADKFNERLRSEPLSEIAKQELKSYLSTLKSEGLNAIKSTWSSLVDTAQYLGDVVPITVVPLGVLGDDLRRQGKELGFQVPDWVPSWDRGWEETKGMGEGALSLAGTGLDVGVLGMYGDLLRKGGIDLPDWAPSKKRGDRAVTKIISDAIDPHLKLLEEGRYGEHFAKMDVLKARLEAEIAVEFLGTKGLSKARYLKWLRHADDFKDISASTKRLRNGVKVKGTGSGKAKASSTPKKLKGGESPATARGRQAHKDWDPGPGYVKEKTLPSGKRPDAINWEKREVVELKPNNPRAIKKGEKQVQQYKKELEEMTGEDWTWRVETYDP